MFGILIDTHNQSCNKTLWDFCGLLKLVSYVFLCKVPLYLCKCAQKEFFCFLFSGVTRRLHAVSGRVLLFMSEFHLGLMTFLMNVWLWYLPYKSKEIVDLRKMASVIFISQSSSNSFPIQTFLVLACHISIYLGGNIIHHNNV